MMASRSLDALFCNNRLQQVSAPISVFKLQVVSAEQRRFLPFFIKEWIKIHPNGVVLGLNCYGERWPESPASHLQLQHQVQSMLPQGVDGIDNQSYNNVDAV